MELDKIQGHGGLFKTPGVGQKLMAGAIDVPVSVMTTAGEGGAWGIALLAGYMLRREPGEMLDSYLKSRVFGGQTEIIVEPDPKDVEGFDTFLKRYTNGLAIERAAVDYLK